MGLQKAGQHVGEAEHGVHRRAVAPGHRRQGVEGAEDEAGAVDQHQVDVGVSRGIIDTVVRRDVARLRERQVQEVVWRGQWESSPSPVPGAST